jgi:uncharacterized protein Yka (UPF0111/DUF47 family)
MANAQSSFLERVLNRFFPKAPDFFSLLALQSEHVGISVGRMVEYMESGDARIGESVRSDEHEADKIKIHNIHVLNEAFSTPIDREDIYRAIMGLDEIVDYCKSTVNEMEALGLKPDKYSLEFSIHIKEGVSALTNGFVKLKTNPAAAVADAAAARYAERVVEKTYRRAIAELFQGDDYKEIFRRREIYRHLSNAADRMAHCANTLHDIIVKMC